MNNIFIICLKLFLSLNFNDSIDFNIFLVIILELMNYKENNIDYGNQM